MSTGSASDASARAPLRIGVITGDEALERMVLAEFEAHFTVTRRRSTSCRQMRETREGIDDDILVCDPKVRDCAAIEAGSCWVSTERAITVVAINPIEDERRAGILIRAGVSDVLAQQTMARLAPIALRERSQPRERPGKRLEVLLEFSPDPVLIVDQDGRIVRVNGMLEELLGHKESELAGKPVEHLIPEAQRARHAGQREAYAAAPNKRPMGRGMQFPALHRDGGKIPVEISLAPIVEGGRTLICCGLRDLRERMRAGRMLRAILEGTATQTGEPFMHALTRNLIEALEVHAAFVAEYAGPGHARMVAFWDGDRNLEPFDYPLAGTPCADFGESFELVVRDRVRERYPRAALLDSIGADSYFAVQLRSHAGDLIGLLGILDTKALEDEGTTRSLLRVFGSRAAAELERVRAEDALRVTEERLLDSNRQLQLLIQSSPLAIYTRDLERLLTSWNPAAEKMYGWKAAEVLGKTLPTVPEELREPSGELHLRLLAGESFIKYETRRRRRDGRLIDIEAFLGPLRDRSGHVNGTIAMAADITERKRAEEALRGSEAKFSKAFHASPDSITLSKLATGEFLEVNEGFERISGYPREEVIGRSGPALGIWAHPEHRAALIGQLASGNPVRDTEVVFRRKDGSERVLLVSLDRIDLGGENCILTIGRDITHLKQAERERAALEAQLRQSQKMEAVGTLAGGIAHDFNNIIGAILGNAELAREDVGPGHPAKQSIGEIKKAGHRARDLVKQILFFGRRRALEREAIALAPVVEESSRLLRATLPAAVQLRVVCAPDAPAVMADATQIEQVLVNLGTNAWHAMEGRPGQVDIRLDGFTVDAALAREHAGLRPGRYARLTVRDKGKGMDAATRERIFEPFFTTKPLGVGTGLGLSVVHGIVQGHEGAITVDSAPGKGTTFHLYLPAADRLLAAALSPAEGASASAAAAAPRGRGQHVLYLDDDEALVSLVSRLLDRQGYRVSGYTLATQALDAVRADPGGFDLVVTDYNMPGMSGLDVARELSRIRPGLPVAVTSGLITDELRENAPGFGVRHLIYKPDTADELCEVVRRLTG
jgi:PAS domain S-box-containing protein